MAEQFYDLRYNFSSSDLVKDIFRDIEVISAEDEMVQIMLIRLLVPRGQYKLNPNFGSDLYLLAREKVTSTTKNQIKKIIIDALKPEIAAGNITDITVETSAGSTNDSIKINIVAKLFNGNSADVNLLLTT